MRAILPLHANPLLPLSILTSKVATCPQPGFGWPTPSTLIATTRNAVQNYRAVVNAGPLHEKAPEAALSLANCQLELKDSKSARQTLEALLRDYPSSDAAATGKSLLNSLK